MDDLDDLEEENRVKTRTLNAYCGYNSFALRTLVEPRRRQYEALSLADQALVRDIIPPNLVNLENCIETNGQFFGDIVQGASELFDAPDRSLWVAATATDEDKMTSTLRQISREWTSEGLQERSQSYSLLIQAVCELFPLDESTDKSPLVPSYLQTRVKSRRNIHVLVPGCGLGRLPFEIFTRGFSVQGNEVSYHMLFAASYFLHEVFESQKHIHPFIHSASHTKSRADQLRSVLVPDINPSVVDETKVGEITMAAGSFDETYGKDSGASFDIIASCFFIDTTANVLQTLRTMHHALKPGGFLVNYGPLLWHFEGRQGDDLAFSGGLEFTRDELWTILARVGFKVVVSKNGFQTVYTSNERAMGRFVYDCDFWIAVKI